MIARLRTLREEWRPSVITGGLPFFPLAVLFGLNAVDELDRMSYAVLLPEIRDHFGLDNEGILTLVAASTALILLLEIPLAHYADRGNRTRIATVGAAMWALFSIGTGLSFAVAMLVTMRVGAGLGRSVVTPTHNSLLADYYAPENRVKVFAFHRVANSVGQIAGPLLAGGIAFYLGWRAPFLLLSIPTIIVLLFALRLKEPARGAQERDLAALLDSVIPHLTFRQSMRKLASVPTLRRVWWCLPFLAVALFGVSSLLTIIYEDTFGLSEMERGMVTAAAEPAQLLGVFFLMPIANRLVMNNPNAFMRAIAVVGVVVAVCLAVLANAPNLWFAISMHFCVAGAIGVLTPMVFAALSLVIPPQVRSLGFSALTLFGIPGFVIALPLIGRLADDHGPAIAVLPLIPMTIIAGFILASAGKTMKADMDNVRDEALALFAAAAPTPAPEQQPEGTPA